MNKKLLVLFVLSFFWLNMSLLADTDVLLRILSQLELSRLGGRLGIRCRAGDELPKDCDSLSSLLLLLPTYGGGGRGGGGFFFMTIDSNSFSIVA